MQRISQINPEQVFYTDFNACNQYQNGLEAAAQVQCPTLLILGQKDMMTPIKAALGLHQAILGSKKTIIQNAGHSMMSEQGDAVLTALREFFSNKD